ncbi:MAG: hypothetical protein ACE5OZ_06370 [Candidatus Heimdallarchaeota archaeon]
MSVTKKKGKASLPKAFELEPLEDQQIMLLAHVRTLTAIKTLNESVHTGTNMMKLKATKVNLEYAGFKEETDETGKKTKKKFHKKETIELDTYVIKGLKGLVRHLWMDLLDSVGISGCHTTDRVEYGKEKKLTIPNGSYVHSLGACVYQGKNKPRKPRNEGCLTYQMFGGRLEQSIITVKSVLVAKANGKKRIPVSASKIEPSRPITFAHVSNETRNVMTIDNKPIQDFRESFFDSNFVLNINVAQCNLVQIGALAEALFHAKVLGGGKTAGYGEITIDRVELKSFQEKQQVVMTEDGLRLQAAKRERNLNPTLQKAFTEWYAYKELHRAVKKADRLTAIETA